MLFKTVVPLATAMLMPAVAYASGGEHGEGGGSGAWFLLLCSFINFSIFVFLMRRFTRTPLRDFLAERRKQIVEELAAAAKAKAEAEELRDAAERRLAGLDEARAQLTSDIEAIAERERERTLTAAREAGDRLIHDAERRARYEFENARRELRAEAARLAAEIAASDLGQRIGEKEQQALLDDFLRKVASS